MASGHNPDAMNPARLSSTQISDLRTDVTEQFNQVTSSQQPGNVKQQIQSGMQLAEKDPNLSFIPNAGLRKKLADRFTKGQGLLGGGSIRERLLRQNIRRAATSSSTLETYYLLLKYTTGQDIDFARYYVRAIAAQDITGPAGQVFGTVTDPYHMMRAYLLNGKTIELVSFRNGKAGNTENPGLQTNNSTGAASNANLKNNANSGDDTSGASDTNRSNYLNFVYSGAALGLFHIEGHSFIGYWDGTTLRRADTFFLDQTGMAFDGLSVKKGGRSLPIQAIEILRLRNPTNGGGGFDPSPGILITVYEAAIGFLSNTGAPHLLLLMVPILLGLLAVLGKKELRNLEHYLIKIFNHLTSRENAIVDGSDAYEDSTYHKALKLLNDNDYTESMQLLEQHVAEDDSDSPAIVTLLENYLFLGEISRYTMLYNAHKKQIDALANGMVSRYLEILKDYQNSHYTAMEQKIEAMKAALDAAKAEPVLWNLDPLTNFLGARPAGLQKNLLIGFLAYLRDRAHRLSKV